MHESPSAPPCPETVADSTLLGAMLDTMDEGVIVVDAAGRFLHFNPAARRIAGLGPVAAEPRDWPAAFGFYHADRTTLFTYEELPLVRALAGETAGPTDIFLRNVARPAGALLRSRGHPLREPDGKPCGAMLVFRDISAEKELEAQFLHAQKMEAVGRLAGGVAHDFNNLLTALTVQGELLLSRLPPDDPTRAGIAEYHSTAHRAAAVTRKLLAFSREQALQARPLDMNQVVAGMEGLVRPILGAESELRIRLAPGAAPVHTDPAQLELAILNLVINARDAMPSGGVLTLETGIREVAGPAPGIPRELTPGRYCALDVRDTGCGMDARVMSHLFEPFFTTKEPGRGTGLGLPMVYGIATRSGGGIVAESESGRGSVFRLFLPCHDRTEAEPPAARPATPLPPVGATLLLVEDEDLVRGPVREFLRSRGYTVHDAKTPEAALGLAARFEIDLLVADMALPHRSGLDLARSASAVRPRMRTLLISGHSRETLMREYRLDSDTPVLEKPFTPDALAQAVRAALEAR